MTWFSEDEYDCLKKIIPESDCLSQVRTCRSLHPLGYSLYVAIAEHAFDT